MYWSKRFFHKSIEIDLEPHYPIWGFHRNRYFFEDGTKLLGEYKYAFGIGKLYILWGFEEI